MGKSQPPSLTFKAFFPPKLNMKIVDALDFA